MMPCSHLVWSGSACTTFFGTGENTRWATTSGKKLSGAASSTVSVRLASSALMPLASVAVPAAISLVPLIWALSVRWYATSEARSGRAARSHPYLKSLGRTGSPFDHLTPERSLKVQTVASGLLVHDSATAGFSSPVL